MPFGPFQAKLNSLFFVPGGFLKLGIRKKKNMEFITFYDMLLSFFMFTHNGWFISKINVKDDLGLAPFSDITGRKCLRDAAAHRIIWLLYAARLVAV